MVGRLKGVRGGVLDDVMRAPVALRIVRVPELEILFVNELYLSLCDRGLPSMPDRLIAAAESGQPIVENEVRLPGAGIGEDTYWAITHAPLTTARGDLHVITTCHDVTRLVVARTKADLAATHLKMDLRNASSRIRQLRTFTAVVAHDLRAPMAAIRFAADLALSRVRGRQVDLNRILGRLVETTGRLDEMVGQLFDYSRFGTGRGLPLFPQRADLHAITQRAVDEVEDRHPNRIVLEVEGDVEGVWDVHRLLEVLSNLILNALDHGAETAPVRVRVDGTNADTVQLVVHNEGVIARKQIPVLFDAFHGSTRRRDGSQGLGLGLYITKQIVVAHGGDIHVESTAAAGTRFVVQLPRRPKGQRHSHLQHAGAHAGPTNDPVPPLPRLARA
jgi:signal transduction histidine kinase